jgi:hypothetical protein
MYEIGSEFRQYVEIVASPSVINSHSALRQTGFIQALMERVGGTVHCHCGHWKSTFLEPHGRPAPSDDLRHFACLIRRTFIA